jgi:hypothetical protein
MRTLHLLLFLVLVPSALWAGDQTIEFPCDPWTHVGEFTFQHDCTLDTPTCTEAKGTTVIHCPFDFTITTDRQIAQASEFFHHSSLRRFEFPVRQIAHSIGALTAQASSLVFWAGAPSGCIPAGSNRSFISMPEGVEFAKTALDTCEAYTVRFFYLQKKVPDSRN